MAGPKVSILLPVHNGARHLRNALESLLHQTFTDFEIDVMNDGSTDDSAAIIQSYRDPRIRYHEQPNAGISASLNRLVAGARGTYLARMDHDDWSHPNRLAAQVAHLEAHPETVLVGSWIEVMDQEGRLTRTIRYPVTATGIRELMLLTNPIGHGSVMLRRVPELLYRSEFDDAEDLDLWERLVVRYKMANLPLPLYRWRENPEGISTRRNRRQRMVARRVRARYRRWYLPRAHDLALTSADLLAERCAVGSGALVIWKLRLVLLLLHSRAAGACALQARDLLRLPFLG